MEEVRLPNEHPVKYVTRLALAKAEAARENATEIILGADTTVVIGAEVLEKPANVMDARRMLRLLAGNEHQVVTGICLLRGERAIIDRSITRVWFAPLTETEIGNYVASGEPMDKAGAYAIQGLASKFVERIDGCYFNVMGLPVPLVYKHWKKLTAAE